MKTHQKYIYNYNDFFNDGSITALYTPTKDWVRNRAFGDCEHHILFRLMEVETPCLVIDGDMLIHSLGNLCEQNKTMVITSTGLILLQKQEDKHLVLTNLNKYRSTFAEAGKGISIIHVDDRMLKKLDDMGITISINPL